jgi:hypothetical protein
MGISVAIICLSVQFSMSIQKATRTTMSGSKFSEQALSLACEESPEFASTLYRIAWISDTSREFTVNELLTLLSKSRENNLRNNITAIALHSKNSFLQIMEGERGKVLSTFSNRIRPSRLHSKVSLCSYKQLLQKEFSSIGRWGSGKEVGI